MSSSSREPSIAPTHLVFEAWTQAELFQRWWVPKSLGLTLLSCELDVRVGGTYRLVFSHPAAPEPMAFHGRYLEAMPPSRLVWTNEEAGENGQVTTVTFEERAGQTLLVVHDLYPSKEALGPRHRRREHELERRDLRPT